MASETEDIFSGPATPPRDSEVDGEVDGAFRDADMAWVREKRHRRAKGKKKKQKTCLMITNDDGTDSTTKDDTKQKKKVYLRPSNNPLLRAPKNSTQFIIDDHENSNLFWNFDAHPEKVSVADLGGDGRDSPEHNQGQYFGMGDCDRLSPDDDTFWTEYSERDFESVYESAHQEEVYSWERSRILEEISVLEVRQKQLIDLLSQIDPLIYLEKLQQELLALQEQNRKLKLINIAERLERQQRGGRSATGSPRLPDSTSRETGESSESDSESSSSENSSDEEGGCGSGCCLLETERERMEELKEDSGDEGGHENTNNSDGGEGLKTDNSLAQNVDVEAKAEGERNETVSPEASVVTNKCSSADEKEKERENITVENIPNGEVTVNEDDLGIENVTIEEGQ